MGAGKTTVGMELAKKLNYKFIDTDHSIENDQSREIKDIYIFVYLYISSRYYCND